MSLLHTSTPLGRSPFDHNEATGVDRRAPRSSLMRQAISVIAAAAVIGAACSSSASSGRVDSSDVAATPSPETYVAIGGSDAVGAGAGRPLSEAWPRMLYRMLDSGTAFLNAAVGMSTVADALEEQLPLALELEPTLVTVSLGLHDVVAGVPAATYERQLTHLIRALRQGGEGRVLIATILPTVERADVREYNDAIARVAAAEGAEVVDLYAAGTEAIADGSFASLVADNGVHPNTEGHIWIAELFAAEL